MSRARLKVLLFALCVLVVILLPYAIAAAGPATGGSGG
jgi:hypothetical protein